MKEALEQLQNKKILLAALLIGLAGTLFFTGLNTVRLKRENREIKRVWTGKSNRGLQERFFAFM